jgi:hypothetical protein
MRCTMYRMAWCSAPCSIKRQATRRVGACRIGQGQGQGAPEAARPEPEPDPSPSPNPSPDPEPEPEPEPEQESARELRRLLAELDENSQMGGAR